jgi:hypothetical protein
MKTIVLIVTALAALKSGRCSDGGVDAKQSAAQAQALEQAHAMVGMPAISNFQEKRMMKDVYELRSAGGRAGRTSTARSTSSSRISSTTRRKRTHGQT